MCRHWITIRNRWDYCERGKPCAGITRIMAWLFPPQRVVLTTSTSEAYSFLFKLLCDPGTEIVVPQPGYPLFDFLAVLDDVRIKTCSAGV